MSELGFWRLAAAEPGATGVVGADRVVVSRGELLSRCNGIVHLLRARGARVGDRVVGVVANEPLALALALACQQAGFYYVPVNTALTSGEISYIIGDAQPVAVFTSVRFADVVGAAADAAGLDADARFSFAASSGFRDLTQVLETHPSGTPEKRTPGAFLGYTSGTTGRPKGVARALAQGEPDDVFAAGAQWQLGMFGIEPLASGVHLVTSPLSHTAVSGLAVTSLHFGHAVVLTDGFDAERVLQLIQDERVTTTHMVPTQLHRLLRLPAEVRERYDVSSMRNLVHGAGPCPESVKRDMLAWFGPVIWEYYGATEAAGTVIDSAEWLARPGSVGRPQPGADVRILDAERNDVPAGEPGAVFLRMGAHAFVYRGDPDKTLAGRHGDYVTVGDIGRIDADGYLYLLARMSEVVVSGGVNVYPAEVEAALLEHPDVRDAGVIGLPDPEWGETVCAVVEAVPGSVLAESRSEATALLVPFLQERLARYKVPRRVEVVDALPRGENGKLRKHLLPALVEKVSS
ncbi:AMP-binding protein [Microbacterium sp. SLBN-146]|uniref:AMP-binding protein n=1 Tax=Microbacterium sp. SLBN-146 TaxID=2768457 RepID=UPI00116AFC0E|nr:AMP-binding protein [Microbacterium sp. SLBN-146]TQJ29935.1 long-chain acyl-CoA synthetase [Microbacterium sp. SLBN-146]